MIPDPLAMGWGVDAAYLPRMLEQSERAAREQFEGALPAELREQLSAEYVVETGPPVNRIVEYAAKKGIDLIVMGTQGRNAVARAWAGSVTQGVLARVACPVVAVRHASV